jgi:hypothetical protein
MCSETCVGLHLKCMLLFDVNHIWNVLTLLVKLTITFHEDPLCRREVVSCIQTDKESGFNTLYRAVNTPKSNSLACTPKFLCFEGFYLCWHE